MNKFLTVMFAVSFLSLSAFGAQKVGFIDMQKAIQSTKAGKDAKKKLEDEFKKKKKELEKKESQLKEMAQDLEKRAMALSEDVRAEKQREFREEQLRFQKLVAESQLNIQKRERELTKPIVDKMLKVIDDVAKKNKYDLVLQKTDMTVLWGKNSLDLTDEVIKEFNKK